MKFLAAQVAIEGHETHNPMQTRKFLQIVIKIASTAGNSIQMSMISFLIVAWIAFLGSNNVLLLAKEQNLRSLLSASSIEKVSTNKVQTQSHSLKRVLAELNIHGTQNQHKWQNRTFTITLKIDARASVSIKTTVLWIGTPLRNHLTMQFLERGEFKAAHVDHVQAVLHRQPREPKSYIDGPRKGLGDWIMQFANYLADSLCCAAELLDSSKFRNETDQNCEIETILYRAAIGKQPLYSKYGYELPSSAARGRRDHLMRLIKEYTLKSMFSEIHAKYDPLSTIYNITEKWQQHQLSTFGELVVFLWENKPRQIKLINKILNQKKIGVAQAYAELELTARSPHVSLYRIPKCKE